MSAGVGAGMGAGGSGSWRWPPVLRRLGRGAPRAASPVPPSTPVAPPGAPPRPAPPRYPAPPVPGGPGGYRVDQWVVRGPAPAVDHLRPSGVDRRGRPGATNRPGARGGSGGAGSHPAADAAALAAAFAVDYLSWNESDPARRGRALAPYIAPSAREEDLVVAGWSGCGRQRAELALPGAVVRLGPTRLLVHVRVRVTPFRRRADAPASASTGGSEDALPFPAAAPAPAHPEWEGLDSYWYELLVPLLEAGGRQRVDIAAVTVVPPLPEAGDDTGGPDP